jgi:mannose-1-phosphate guanylyltransferase / phosphomannomutase
MKAVILCGGFGTRLRPLTLKIPKPMIEIAGKPMVEHLILLCKIHKITDIYIAAHYLVEQIQDYFGDGSKWGINIHFSIEKEPMDSAGAIKLIEKELNETFVVLNGDVMTNLNIEKMAKFHKENKAILSFIVHKSTHPYDSQMIDVDDNWQVKGILPPPKKGDRFKNLSKSGTVVMDPKIFSYIPAGQKYSIEKALIQDLIAQKAGIYAYYSEEYSHDAGTPERLERVRNDFKAGKVSIL